MPVVVESQRSVRGTMAVSVGEEAAENENNVAFTLDQKAGGCVATEQLSRRAKVDCAAEAVLEKCAEVVVGRCVKTSVGGLGGVRAKEGMGKAVGGDSIGP